MKKKIVAALIAVIAFIGISQSMFVLEQGEYAIVKQFGEVVDIILQHKSRASKVVNEELLLTAWHVGGYVSAKLKSEEWGSKVVSQLSEYIRSQRPDIKGYSRRSIYNMVMFYEEYSSETFNATVEKYLNSDFVQSVPAQIEVQSNTLASNYKQNVIVQNTENHT